MNSDTRQHLKKKGGPLCIVSTITGLVVTFLLLNLQDGAKQNIRPASCNFNMSSNHSPSATYTLFNAFTLCAASHVMNVSSLHVQHFTAMMADQRLLVHLNMTLNETWHRTVMKRHVLHLFTNGTQYFCTYPFITMQSECSWAADK
jgi:hypothetical protein